MSFEKFISYFPVVEPPFTITETSIDSFKQNNDYLPGTLTEEWLETIEGEESDEFTEFFPCLRLPDQDNYIGILYWKASLLRYEFILSTLTKKGQLIDKRVIAGMLVRDSLIIKSVANIDEDLIIHVMTGSFFHDDIIDSDDNKPFSLEILPSGEIVSSF
jgi:hypothetical protein